MFDLRAKFYNSFSEFGKEIKYDIQGIKTSLLKQLSRRLR